jgi:hypothetical protein
MVEISGNGIITIEGLSVPNDAVFYWLDICEEPGALPVKVRPLAIPQIVGIAQSQFQTANRKPEAAEQSTSLTNSRCYSETSKGGYFSSIPQDLLAS